VAGGFGVAVAVVIGAAAFDNAAVPVVVAVESMVDCNIARGKLCSVVTRLQVPVSRRVSCMLSGWKADSNLEDALSPVT
jgi:hypothetical protein